MSACPQRRTWPWRHGTLRGFSSAVITPMLLWGAQQAFARWFQDLGEYFEGFDEVVRVEAPA